MKNLSIAKIEQENFPQSEIMWKNRLIREEYEGVDKKKKKPLLLKLA